MTKKITRRDFINGVSIGAAGLLLGSKNILASAVQESTGGAAYYPPTLTGLRGSHEGSFEVAHNLAWRGVKPEHFDDLQEEYDLVVVGGGVSGLSAAYLFQKNRGGNQRILILDNHDDFGGHAKRNEFHTQGKMLLGFGGSVNMESPTTAYSHASRTLLEEVGVDFDKLERSMDPEYPFASLRPPIGLCIKTEAADTPPVVGPWMHALHGIGDYRCLINRLPLPESDREKIISLVDAKADIMVGMTVDERMSYLSTTSYHEFLSSKAGFSADAVATFDAILLLNNGVGGESLSAMEAFTNGCPGLRATGHLGKIAVDLGFDPQQPYDANFFPDGNASVARLLVRKLVAQVAPGNSMDDIVSARFDYSKLDLPESDTRIRLNSTAVSVKHTTDDQVEVGYVSQGNAYKVKAKHAILACYNGLIPHLCPELPEAQKENLKYGVKVPFLWTNVVLRKGTSFYNSGAQHYECPKSYFHVVTKAPPTAMDDYQAPQSPDDPMVVFMGRSVSPPNDGQSTARDLFRQGRHILYSTPFETFEAEVRQQLTEMFGAQGFDADRDIEAITINRWSHGYAYVYYALYDSEFEEGQSPHELGRKQFGRISIANSDSEGRAYLDAAIDAGSRAVKEQLFNVPKD